MDKEDKIVIIVFAGCAAALLAALATNPDLLVIEDKPVPLMPEGFIFEPVGKFEDEQFVSLEGPGVVTCLTTFRPFALFMHGTERHEYKPGCV